MFLWTGLAMYLGLSRSTLDMYSSGELETDCGAIQDLLQYYRTALEMQRERQLTDKDFATTGVMFALKNHHGWKDEKHIHTDTQTAQINVILDSGSILAKQLSDNDSVTIEQAPDGIGTGPQPDS